MRKSLVESREHPAPFEINGKAVFLRSNRQRVPDIGGYIRIDADDFLLDAVTHQQKRRAVSERINLDEVVVLRRSYSQCKATALTGCAGNCLETQGEVPVLQRGRSTKCKRFCRFVRGCASVFDGTAGRSRRGGHIVPITPGPAPSPSIPPRQ